jgi:glycerol-3-phosphate cytidylyltransferase-like family protein
MRKRTARQGDWQQHKEALGRAESAHHLYETMNKKPKKPVLVAKQRINHLQKDEWTDKVFTGDNPDTTAHLSQAAAERDTHIGQSIKGRTAVME